MEHNKDDIKAVTDLFRTMADFFVKYIVPIIKYQLVQAIEGIGIGLLSSSQDYWASSKCYQ
jgi:hypothetical protein